MRSELIQTAPKRPESVDLSNATVMHYLCDNSLSSSSSSSNSTNLLAGPHMRAGIVEEEERGAHYKVQLGTGPLWCS